MSALDTFLFSSGALGAVAKIDLNNLLILAGEIDRLRRGVDHMGAVAGELFDDVSTGLAAVTVKEPFTEVR